MPTEHSHVMGGSSADRRIYCPGSYKMEKAAPERETSEYAEEGSMLHAAMELLLTEDPDPHDTKNFEALLAELVGQNMGFEGYEITEEHIDSKIRPAYLAWFALAEEYDVVDIFIEQKVSLENVIPGAFGTADIIGVTRDNDLLIADWKFGDGVKVYVEGHLGTGFYAAGALYDESDEELAEVGNQIPEDAKIILAIIQPRRGFPDEEVASVWETDINWVESLIDQAMESYKLAMSDNPPLNPGDHCRWCSANGRNCPAQKQMSLAAIKKAPSGMTAIELSDNLKIAALAAKWASEVFKFGQAQAENGVQIPGWKLVDKRPSRVWTDEEAAEKAFKAARIKKTDMYETKLISPPQAEKKFPKVYTTKLSEHVAKISSGLTLAPVTDKRPAVADSMALLSNAMDKAAKKA